MCLPQLTRLRARQPTLLHKKPSPTFSSGGQTPAAELAEQGVEANRFF